MNGGKGVAGAALFLAAIKILCWDKAARKSASGMTL